MRAHFAQTCRCTCVCAHSVECVCTCMCVCANHHVCMKTLICPCTRLWPCAQMCTFSHTNMHSRVLRGHTNTHEHVQTHMNTCACMCAQSICLAEQGHQHISAEQGLGLLPGVFPRKGVAPFHRGSWKGDLPVSLPLDFAGWGLCVKSDKEPIGQDVGSSWMQTSPQHGAAVQLIKAILCVCQNGDASTLFQQLSQHPRFGVLSQASVLLGGV